MLKKAVFDGQNAVLYAPLIVNLYTLAQCLSKNVYISLMPLPSVGGATGICFLPDCYRVYVYLIAMHKRRMALLQQMLILQVVPY